MPEMTFTVGWPDGSVTDCYSPSLVMHDYLSPNSDYTVTEFVDRTRAALDLASERVRAKFGFACTSAMAQRDEIITKAQAFPGATTVRVLTMHPPLPETESGTS